MSTYRTPYKKRRRRLNIKLITALFALVGAVGAISMGVANWGMSKKLDKTNVQIESIQNETKEIEAQIPDLEASAKDLNKEVTSLQNILWRYEPVVIPESMK